jgi:hypothetical protein
MSATKRIGVILVADKSWPATVALSVTRNPGGAVGRQEVEVRFHDATPSSNTLVIAGEMIFRDDEGNEHPLQYGGDNWRLRNAGAFLR